MSQDSKYIVLTALFSITLFIGYLNFDPTILEPWEYTTIEGEFISAWPHPKVVAILFVLIIISVFLTAAYVTFSLKKILFIFFIANMISLIHYFYNAPFNVWINIVNLCAFLIPFFIDALRTERFEDLRFIKDIDVKILKIAKQYGGILTKSVVVYELNTTLEQAETALERFYNHKEANKKIIDTINIYDFPSVRNHLNKIDIYVIELLRDNHNGLTRGELLSKTGLLLESFEKSLSRLESYGIIIYNSLSDKYMLRGISF